MKNYTVPSYDQRVSRIKCVEDIDKELDLAENYARYLGVEAKKAVMLEEKLSINEFKKEADRVLLKLRRSVFDIEDALLAAAA